MSYDFPIITVRDHKDNSTSSSSTSFSPFSSPVAIAGWSAAGAVLVGLIVWLSWILLKTRKKRPRSDEEKCRRPIPAEWMILPHSNDQFDPCSFQPSQLRPPPFSRAMVKPTTVLPDKAPATSLPQARWLAQGFDQQQSPRSQQPSSSAHQTLQPPRIGAYHQHMRTLSVEEEQILAHHTATNTIPRPFAPLDPGDPSRVPPSPHSSIASFASPLGPSSRPSSATRQPSGLPQRILSHVRAQPFSIASTVDVKGHSATASFASSFSFASMPYRSGPLSPARTSLATPAVRRIQPGTHQVHHIFTPLLPDEIELVAGERVTVVDTYDDGWCVVIRSGSSDLRMGAVPAWCFDQALEGAQDRPERKSSLGVTVALDGPPPPVAESKRHEIKTWSWSNF